MTSNPTTNVAVYENQIIDSNPMTISGAINKTAILLGITILTSIYTWNLVFASYMDKATLLLWIGIIAGLVLAIIMRFRPQNAGILSVFYAICEGLAIGTISAMYEKAFDGIVGNAALATFATLGSMLFLYKANIIKATQKFRSIIVTATIGIMIFYLIQIVMAFFGANFLPVWQSGPLGIGISVAICIIAALNFILDFDFIERGAQSMVPKYFEWYGAFSLLVTMIWLYLEILRLLAKLNSRNN